MTVHGFNERLAFSHSYDNAPWWREAYQMAFGPRFRDMASVRQDGWAQRAGIDRQVYLTDGTVLKIDEKVRSKEYPDILLEKWSDRDRRVPGWIQKDLSCDYIAYAFVGSKRCYLLPFLLLQRAWRIHGEQWRSNFGVVPAQNVGYVTESVPVPINVLIAAIAGAMTVVCGVALPDRASARYQCARCGWSTNDVDELAQHESDPCEP